MKPYLYYLEASSTSMHHDDDDDDGEDVMSRRVSLGRFVFLHLVTNLLRVELYRAETDRTTATDGPVWS